MQGQKALHHWQSALAGQNTLCKMCYDHAREVEMAGWQEGTHEPKVQERSMPVLTSALKMTSTSAGVFPLFLR